ncbi:MAG: aminotransferase class III-fold pyridoxal phosphate-dependent enzyme [Ferruginibacter sp.]
MLPATVFLQLIRSLCDKYDSVFIADSVQCGYGRTGKFYSQDFSGVSADIYSMAKGMGNGFPCRWYFYCTKTKSQAFYVRHYFWRQSFSVCGSVSCA